MSAVAGPDTTQPSPLAEDTASVTLPTPLEMRPHRGRRRRLRLGFSLFWRTFFLLALLLMGCIFVWLQTFRSLEDEPRSVQTAHQIASLVNLTRAALVYSDAITRVSLIKTLADQEGVRILPREPHDRFQTYTQGTLDRRVTEELVDRLGEGTVIASRVGGIPEALGKESAALVTPGDATDLARVMAEALAKPEWGHQTMPSTEAVKAVFSAPVMAKDVLKLYYELIGQTPTSSII